MALSSEAKARVKEKVFQRLGEVGVETEPAVSWWAYIRQSVLVKSYVLVPLVLLLFVISTTAVSANALPGDILYPVKRQVENTRVLLAPTQQAKQELELNFAEERLRELEKVQAADSVKVEQPKTPSNNPGNKKSGTAGDTDSKDNSSDKAVTGGRNSSPTEREIRARRQAEGALEFLKQTKEQYREHKDIQRAEDLDKKIEDYRKRLLRENGDRSGSEENSSRSSSED